jgi:hypothetical protein
VLQAGRSPDGQRPLVLRGKETQITFEPQEQFPASRAA